MEFLKNILKEKYQEFCDIIEKFNKENPDKAVKLVNVADGNFVEKSAYDELNTKYENDTKLLNDKMNKIHFDHDVERLLKEAGAKNIKAVMALIDMKKVSYDNGEVKGLSEQINEIKKSDGYLFDEKNAPKFTRPLSGDGKITREDFKKLSYMEKLKLKKEAPHIYSKLK